MRVYQNQITSPHQFVKKGWGFELWLENNDKYCGKILHIEAGKKFSWHFHRLKDETFHVLRGRVLLTYGFDQDIAKAQTIILGPDDTFRIPVMLIHRVEGLEDSDIFEFSTTHYDSDSYRILKGD